jgi:hypothetical protein
MLESLESLHTVRRRPIALVLSEHDARVGAIPRFAPGGFAPLALHG